MANDSCWVITPDFLGWLALAPWFLGSMCLGTFKMAHVQRWQLALVVG